MPGVMVRMPLPHLAALDAWITAQRDPKLTRPEVIREALTGHLKAKGYLK